MRISHKGIVALEGREGIRLTVYRDSKGLPTVGVGHLVIPADHLKVGDKIRQAHCDDFLAFDLKRFEDAVNTSVKVSLTQNQFDACVSLAFNIGESGFKGSTVVKRLNASDYDGAANAFMRWVKPPEITGRRKTEVKQFLTPDSPSVTAEPTQVTSRPLLKKGSRGQDVKDLQTALGIIANDGIFGLGTEVRVKEFQRSHGLTADGMVGAQTWAKLGA